MRLPILSQQLKAAKTKRIKR